MIPLASTQTQLANPQTPLTDSQTRLASPLTLWLGSRSLWDSLRPPMTLPADAQTPLADL